MKDPKITVTEREQNYTYQPKQIRELAEVVFSGFVSSAGKSIILILILVGVISLVSSLLGIGVDDTDRDAWHRSGMSLYTDYGTGVQYLSAGGALTPRIGADGKVLTTPHR